MDKIEAYNLPLNYEQINTDIEIKNDLQKSTPYDLNSSRNARLSFSGDNKIKEESNTYA